MIFFRIKNLETVRNKEWFYLFWKKKHKILNVEYQNKAGHLLLRPNPDLRDKLVFHIN